MLQYVSKGTPLFPLIPCSSCTQSIMNNTGKTKKDFPLKTGTNIVNVDSRVSRTYVVAVFTNRPVFFTRLVPITKLDSFRNSM